MNDSPKPAPVPVHGWVVLLVIAMACFLVPLPASIVDQFYSRDLYPALQVVLTTGSNLIPIAVLDLLIGLVVSLFIVRFTFLLLAAHRRGLRSVAWEGVRRVIRVAAVVAIAFMCAWGCNYRRVPLEASLVGGQTARLTDSTIEAAVSQSLALATRLRPIGSAGEPRSFAQVAALLREPMNAALTELNLGPLAQPGRPKFSALFTPFFTWAGVDGMINPLGLESIVNPELLPFERPFVLAHEWAHLAGEADEAEASAVGWFACMHGPPELAYSASLYLVMEGAAVLSPDAYRRALANLDPGIRLDFEAVRQRVQRQNPRIQHTASLVYDKYLKANRVADGTASYGRALSVILSPPLRDALGGYRWKGK